MTLPTHYAVLLYPGFQLLDVAGPLDILNLLSSKNDIKLSILSSTMDPVATMPKTAFSQSIVPTHTFADAPEDIEVLLVPGGLGARDADNIQPAVDYVKKVYPKLQYLITICTGSALVAKAGVLDGVKATSNKAAFEWVRSVRPQVKWEKKARWVVDSNIWTSSGISAGIDVTYAFVGKLYGEEVAQNIADRSEYIRNKDSAFDPFADMY